MSAIVRQDWRPKTLRELFVQWQAVLLETWHHTAHLKGCFSAKQGTNYSDLHPYIRKVKLTAIVIKPDSLFVQSLGNENDFFEQMFGELTNEQIQKLSSQ